MIAAAEPTEGCVVIDEAQRDDYRGLRLPSGWAVVENPAGLSLLQALNWIFETFPNFDWYGLTSDDFMVRTANWSAPLVEAAGTSGFANSADGWQAGGPDKRMHGAVVFGGDLLRAFGWWAPPGLTHCFAEDFWERVGRELKNWRYLPDIMVEHCHAWNGKAHRRSDTMRRHIAASMPTRPSMPSCRATCCRRRSSARGKCWRAEGCGICF